MNGSMKEQNFVTARRLSMAKHYDLRKINKTDFYTVAEIAQKLGITEKTVRNWSEDGLSINKERRPFFIYGNDLHSYLKKTYEKSSTKLNDFEFYCFHCKKSVKIISESFRVDRNRQINGKRSSSTLILFNGVCEICKGQVCRIGSKKILKNFMEHFESVDAFSNN